MKILTVEETQAVLKENHLDQVQAVGLARKEASEALFYAWHAHPTHQILFARKGTTQVEGEAGRHLLPAGHALWIPAQMRHRTMIRNLDGVSLFLAPEEVETDCRSIRAFPVSPLIQEMLFYALRWSEGVGDREPLAKSFLQTLVLLLQEAIQAAGKQDFVLPKARHPSLQRAMDAALLDPGAASLAIVLREAGMSERSFRRYFDKETGMNWQQWITQARLFHAATSLARGESVTQVAAESGYASQSAFAKAFTRLLGCSPARFRSQSG
ncbi:helix-turn-helix transcriptional regulator [Asaia spathodeae]|uniref:Helix-turn-helix transcriptional regulator n=1 Tax=Asaia spathodeae TaxID=657016 RepID=A0ABX2P0A1_9PROT|nr:helix-turn-helix transcriptional regulator [Asaia spathodeae]GBR15007.1 AraC family transcriptional regulator [Asaia spathodeae NBRC 105894]